MGTASDCRQGVHCRPSVDSARTSHESLARGLSRGPNVGVILDRPRSRHPEPLLVKAPRSVLQSSPMKRRTVLQMWTGDRLGGSRDRRGAVADKLDVAADVLTHAVAEKQVDAGGPLRRAPRQRDRQILRGGPSADDLFLLGLISKPITVTALMTLYDQGRFRLDDPVRMFPPQPPARAWTDHGSPVAHACIRPPQQLPENQRCANATPHSQSSWPRPSAPRSCC